MGILLFAILLFIGINGLRKGRISISNTRAIEGAHAKMLSIFYLAAAILPLGAAMLYPEWSPLLSLFTLVAVCVVTVIAVAVTYLGRK